MDLSKRFGTDKRLEQDGVDVHLGEDAYITIARAGGSNTRYQTEMTRAFRANKRALQNDSLTPSEADRLMQTVFARAVVLGWRGIELNGEKLDFNEANALRLFAELPEIFRIVQEEAQRLANFRAEEIHERGNA